MMTCQLTALPCPPAADLKLGEVVHDDMFTDHPPCSLAADLRLGELVHDNMFTDQ